MKKMNWSIPYKSDNDIIYSISGGGKKIEISEDTLRGLFLILCGTPTPDGSNVYDKAVPMMVKAQKEIIELGDKLGFDCRGGDL